ncbi:YceD family protein [Maritalea mediterranea]|uniref:DUF177 domain-containing protein n=1 Tax=Maritalea mediterranea TaxID=2909667 RepID=A0ABS9E5P8_9HYPH|nr:DUF177 domain-containing protein [Maritalea mediterranea]MCF4098185.1 DUF177 domain-containing protein [Maritalea mediterranea]
MAGQDIHKLLDLEVRLSEVPKDGRSYEFDADQDAKEALVAETKLEDVKSFSGKITMRPFRGGYQAKGEGQAVVEQACVVTLEPVEEEVALAFERIYMPGKAPEPDVAPNAEVFVNLDSEPDQDWYEGDAIDLAPMVVETLMLSLNPYPRKPDAEFADLTEDERDESESPFAALAALKDKK